MTCGATTTQTTGKKQRPHAIPIGPQSTPPSSINALRAELRGSYGVLAVTQQSTTLSCPRKKGKRPMTSTDDALPSAKFTKQRPEVCYNFNYRRPCHYSPCPYKHQCIKCFPEEHALLDCPKRSKKEPPTKKQ